MSVGGPSLAVASACAFCAGIALVERGGHDLLAPCLGVLALVAAPRSSRGFALLLLFAALGAGRAVGVRVRHPVDLGAGYCDRDVVLRGVVCEPVTKGARGGRLVVRARVLACGLRLDEVSLRILVIYPLPACIGSPVSWGQEITAVGRLRRLDATGVTPRWAARAHSEVDAVLRLRSAGDVTACGEGDLGFPLGWAAAVRRSAERGLDTALPPSTAAICKGVLLAEAGEVEPLLADAFRDTGTFHVLVTAGIHVSFLTAGVIALLGAAGVGGAVAALLAIPWVAFYTLVAGASPSIVRAAITGCLALVAHASGREPDGRRSLSVAVLVMTAWSPALVTDPGFQMSVACVTGILHLSPRIARRLSKLPSYLARSLAVALSTQIMIAPLTALYFGGVSLAGVLANLLVVPLCELLLALAFALSVLGAAAAHGTMLGLGGGPLSWFVLPLAWAATLDARLVATVVRGFQQLPGCALQVPAPDGRELVLWYALVLLAATGTERSAEQEPETSEPLERTNRP